MTLTPSKIVIVIQLIVIIILGVWINICSNSTDIIERVRVDTLRTVEIRVDSFYIEKPIYIKAKIPEPEIIEVVLEDTTRNVNRYNTNISDSLIDGNIVSVVNGVLIGQELFYTPKFPRYIRTTETVTVNRDVTRTIRDRVLTLGGGVRITDDNSSSFDFYPSIRFIGKSRRTIGYSYGVLDRSHSVDITLPIKVGLFGL